MPHIDVDRIWETVIALLFATAGGLARLLSANDKRKMRRGRLLSELFISGFAGLMVLLLARTFGLSGDWLGLVSGMAGWIGPRMLDMVIKPVGKALGMDTDDKKEE